VNITIENLGVQFGQTDQVRDALGTSPQDWRAGLSTAHELRCDEDMYLVDGIGIEEAPQYLAATFNKEVGPSSPAEFVEHGGDRWPTQFLWKEQYLAALAHQRITLLWRCKRGSDDERAYLPGRATKPALQRQAQSAVKDDTGSGTPPGRAGSQLRVVREHSADTNQNRIDTTAKFMDDLPRSGVGDPPGVTRPGGDPAIEGHGPLGDDPRATSAQQFEIWRVEPASVGFAETDLHADTGLSQKGCTPAGDLGEGVRHGGHDTTDASGQDGIGAGRRFAVVTARLQGDIKRGTPGGLTGGVERMNLGVRSTVTLVPALADAGIPLDDDGADHGVGLDCTAPAGR
jgi:hypothetical protein